LFETSKRRLRSDTGCLEAELGLGVADRAGIHFEVPLDFQNETLLRENEL